MSKPLPFNKANFIVLEQERNLLKITLEFYLKENEKLKAQLDDMQMTMKHNKEQLDEYVTKITNKDIMFEKMTNQIEQLTNRLKSLESSNKKGSKNFQTEGDLTKGTKNIEKDRSNTQNNSIHLTTNNSFSNNKVIMLKGNNNTKKNEEKLKEFFQRQSEILDEMNGIKDDVQFLLENKSKTKLKEHLEQSMSSNRSNRSNVSNSSNSYISSNGNVNELDSLSILNSSMYSNCSAYSKGCKINLKDRYNFDKNLTEFFAKYNEHKNVLILVDSKGELWELIHRKDLNSDFVKSHPDKIKSIFQTKTENKNNLKEGDISFDNGNILNSQS